MWTAYREGIVMWTEDLIHHKIRELRNVVRGFVGAVALEHRGLRPHCDWLAETRGLLFSLYRLVDELLAALSVGALLLDGRFQKGGRVGGAVVGRAVVDGRVLLDGRFQKVEMDRAGTTCCSSVCRSSCRIINIIIMI